MGDEKCEQNKTSHGAQPQSCQQPQPVPKTAPIKIFAGFTGLPGSSTTGSIETKEANALWLGLNLTSKSDLDNNESIPKTAVSRGHTTKMGIYNAPLGSDGRGVGDIAARLDYAKDIAQSLSISIAGLERTESTRAKTLATKMVIDETTRIGDVSAIASRVSDALTAQYGKPVTVSVTQNVHAVTDAGERQLSYTIRGPATLDLDVKAMPVSERTIHSGKDTVEADNLASEGEGHAGSSTDTKVHTDVKTNVGAEHHQNSSVVGVSWKETVTKTVQEIQTAFDHVEGTFEDTLTKKIDDAQHFDRKEHDVEHSTVFDHLKDHATKSDKTKEGDEKEKNFWSYLKTGINVINSIPVPWALNPIWRVGIGAAKGLSDGLAVDANVHFKNRDETFDRDRKDTVKTDRDNRSDNSGHSKQHYVDVTTIKDTVNQYLTTLKTKFTNEVNSMIGGMGAFVAKQSSGDGATVGTDTKIDHDQKSNGGGSVHTNVNHGKTTTLKYDVTSKETFLRPELVATVVGDMEVSG